MSRPEPAAGVVVIGTELLADARQETNGPWICGVLAEEGFRPAARAVVGDDRADIARAMGEALARFDLVVACGGLGPTFDDVTREAAADALGLRLEHEEALLDRLRERYRSRGLRMPDAVARMADVLETAEILANPVGSAPGQLVKGPPALVLLPGVPAEMEAMMRREVIPRLPGLGAGPRRLRRLFRIAGLYESQVEARLAEPMKSWKGVGATILASPGDVSFILRAPAGGEEALDAASASVRAILGASVYSESERSLEAVVGDLLRARSLTLATAESCTGGLLGGMITAVPGSSDYYLGGFVTYGNTAKESWLGVDPSIFAEHGAVSSETALEMARGARKRAGASVTLAVTGVAGPGGGTESKPVGRVYVALDAPWGAESKELTLPGNREIVRRLSCRAALNLLRLRLLSGKRSAA